MRKHEAGFGVVIVLVLLVAIGIVGVAGWYVYDQNKTHKITNFEECVAAGHPVAESFPEQCHANGQTFVNQKEQDVIDYEYQVMRKDLPASLQTAILKVTKQDAPNCVKGDQYVDSRGKPTDLSKEKVSYKENAAFVGVGCEGGAIYFFGMKNGEWAKLAATQMAFKCELLKQYEIPTEWITGNPQIAGECFEGAELVPYP